MSWNNLSSVEQLEAIHEKSNEKPQVIFKHSTRCSVSSFAKRILDQEFNDEINSKVDAHYLDLISFRDVSNTIATKYNVIHESPQILLIDKGVCTYNASHSNCSFEGVLSNL